MDNNLKTFNQIVYQILNYPQLKDKLKNILEYLNIQLQAFSDQLMTPADQLFRENNPESSRVLKTKDYCNNYIDAINLILSQLNPPPNQPINENQENIIFPDFGSGEFAEYQDYIDPFGI